MKCHLCRKNKPDTEFHVSNSRRGDGRKRHLYCKSCKAAYNKRWYRKNKDKHCHNVLENNRRYRERGRRLIVEAKRVPCRDCGIEYPPYVMDFDHREPHTKVDCVARMVKTTLSLVALKKEIAKCDVVCANCHRERTHGKVELKCPRGAIG